MTFLNTQDYALSKGLVIKEFDLNSSIILKHLKPKDGVKLTPKRFKIFSERICNEIIQHFEHGSKFYPVGFQGKSDVLHEEEIGSYRVTTHDVNFAKFLTSYLLSSYTSLLTPITFDEYSPVDWQSDNPDGLNYWIPLHVSPVFRYMKYGKGGKHATHYDQTFKLPENPLIRTMQSGVLYLSTNEVYTRFINDEQDDLLFVNRNHNDWERETLNSEVIDESKSEKGKVLLFPHYLPHDVSENFEDEERIIIRFDIFYQAVGKI